MVADHAVGALCPVRPQGVGATLPPRAPRAAQGPAQPGNKGCQSGCCVRRFVPLPACVISLPSSTWDRHTSLVVASANDVPSD